MPLIVKIPSGTVSGLWGQAILLKPDGQRVLLKLGMNVHQGDRILTTQDGIVQITDEDGRPWAPGATAAGDAPPVAAPPPVTEDGRPKASTAKAVPEKDVDAVIAGIDSEDNLDAPGAGLSGDGAGRLGLGLRVDRVQEDTTGQSFDYATADRAAPQQIATAQPLQDDAAPAPAPQPPAPSAGNDGNTLDEDVVQPITGQVLVNDASLSGGTLKVGTVAAVTAGGSAEAVGTEADLKSISGAYGALILLDDGRYTYALENTNAAVQALQPGQTLTEVFQYTVTDSNGRTSTANLTITINGTAPAGTDGSAAGSEDAPLALDATAFGLSVADLGSRVGAVRIDSLPAHGTLSLNGAPVAAGQLVDADDLGDLVFTPDANFNGSTSLSFSVQDPWGEFDLVPNTLALNIAPVNDAPVAAPDTLSLAEDTPLTFDPRANDSDPDGDPLAITQINGQPIATGSPVTLPQGTVSLNADGTLTFTPNANYNGPVHFDYTVSDGSGSGNATATGSVDLTVTPANDAPTLADDTATTPINQPVVLTPLANDGDVDGNPLTIVQVGGQPIAVGTPVTLPEGTVTLNPDGTLSFMPGTDVTGPIQIPYTVSDGQGGSSTATITVAVGANTPPTGADLAVTISEDGSRGFTAADFGYADADAGQGFAAVRIDTLPAAGTLTLGGVAVTTGQLVLAAQIGQLVYTPAADGHGSPYAAFTFSVQDSAGAFDTVPNTVTITVTPANDDPVAVNDTVAAAEDTPITFDPRGNDSDVDGDALAVTSVGGQAIAVGSPVTVAQGVVSLNADGTLTFTPNAHYNGSFSLAYGVADGHGGTAAATIDISVAAVNDAPVAVNDTAFAAINTAVLIAPLSNDSDPDGTTPVITQIAGQAV
ncbi:MAG: tandem-95 repeat protein, partial [Aquabacterium sp.]